MSYTWRGTGLYFSFDSEAEHAAFLAEVNANPNVANVVVNGLTVTLDFDNTGE